MEDKKTFWNIALTLLVVIVVLVYTRHIEEESMREGNKQGYDIGHSEGYDEGRLDGYFDGYSDADRLSEEIEAELYGDAYMHGYYQGYTDKSNGLPYDESVGRPLENNGYIFKEGEGKTRSQDKQS